MPEYLCTGVSYSLGELCSLARQHKLEQFSHRSSILPYLNLGRWIEDRKTGINVPFAGLYAHHDVDLDVLNAANVTW